MAVTVTLEPSEIDVADTVDLFVRVAGEGSGLAVTVNFLEDIDPEEEKLLTEIINDIQQSNGKEEQA